MQRPVYIVLAGLPGSGKSTIRRSIAEAWSVGALIELSTDDYIDMVALQGGQTYSEVFASSIKSATTFMNAKKRVSIRCMQNIIMDRTNLSVKSRQAALDVVPDIYLKVCLFQVVPEDVRQPRLAERPGKIIPPEADHRMQAVWEPPTLAEGFDAVLPATSFALVLRPWLQIMPVAVAA